jgi:putative transposase
MTSYRRNFVPGGSYFFTVNLADRRQRLLVEHIDLLRSAFRYARAGHEFTIEAIAILPEHLHAIWTLPDGDADFALRWRLIKATFSRGLPKIESLSEVERASPNAAFGRGAIGNTRYETNEISNATSITSISTQ